VSETLLSDPRTLRSRHIRRFFDAVVAQCHHTACLIPSHLDIASRVAETRTSAATFWVNHIGADIGPRRMLSNCHSRRWRGARLAAVIPWALLADGPGETGGRAA